MNLEVAKKLIRKHIQGHEGFTRQAIEADRYYRVKNDILTAPGQEKRRRKLEGEKENPLRTADNRVANAFYPLLVDQKVAYMFTAPPLFDVKDDVLNQYIAETLGDMYTKNAQELCVRACNAGRAWVHYWIDDNNTFRWAVVPSEQIISIHDPSIAHEVKAVLRTYKDIDDDSGETYTVYEYWTDTECEVFRTQSGDLELLEYAPVFELIDNGQLEQTNVYQHNMGAVPFIEFRNNSIESSDLSRVKKLIDAYDKVYSGFLNDLEDVQEVIFILTNYTGQDTFEFLNDLKFKKTVQIDSMGADDRSGVSTLTIDIPVEARKEMLDTTRKAIFDHGQGVDPTHQGLDGTSGEAMKFLYSLLELKAGMTETEFRLGFNRLIRAICHSKGRDDIGTITQTWTRTSIRNDAELVAMCSQSMGVISRKTILKNHPFVDNAEDEEKELQAEEEQDSMYPEGVGQKTTVKTEEGDNDDT